MYENLLANVPTDLWIGGKWRKASDGGRFDVIDPATENRLRAKLNDAQAALDRGNVTVVRNKLSDFIDVCTKRLPADVANVLVADARYVLSTL